MIHIKKIGSIAHIRGLSSPDVGTAAAERTKTLFRAAIACVQAGQGRRLHPVPVTAKPVRVTYKRRRAIDLSDIYDMLVAQGQTPLRMDELVQGPGAPSMDEHVEYYDGSGWVPLFDELTGETRAQRVVGVPASL